MQQIPAPAIVQRANWTWTPNGLLVSIRTKGGGRQRVLMPIQSVDLIFGSEMQRAGVGAAYGVGACEYTVAGFFKKLGRGIKRLGRKVVPKVVRRAAKKVGRVAKKIAKGVKSVVTHPVFRAGFAAISTAFPVLAPAAAGLEVASRVMKTVDKGRKAAKAIGRGVKTVRNLTRVRKATKARRGVASMIKLARRGDPRAQRTMGALTAIAKARGSRVRPSRRGVKRRTMGRSRYARSAARSAARRSAMSRRRAMLRRRAILRRRAMRRSGRRAYR